MRMHWTPDMAEMLQTLRDVCETAYAYIQNLHFSVTQTTIRPLR